MGYAELTEHDFSVDELAQKLADPANGCVVTFVGVVRGTSQGAAPEETPSDVVETMEVEAYREMAIEQMQALINEAKKTFEITDAIIVHRIGTLAVGDNIVCIAVSAPHRAAGFDACEWLIDELKKRVPLWKAETIKA